MIIIQILIASVYIVGLGIIGIMVYSYFND